MSKTIALLTLLLASLACSLPFSTPTNEPAGPTLDVATLVAESLTAAVGTVPAAPPLPETATPEPAPTNLNIAYARSGSIIL